MLGECQYVRKLVVSQFDHHRRIVILSEAKDLLFVGGNSDEMTLPAVVKAN